MRGDSEIHSTFVRNFTTFVRGLRDRLRDFTSLFEISGGIETALEILSRSYEIVRVLRNGTTCHDILRDYTSLFEVDIRDVTRYHKVLLVFTLFTRLLSSYDICQVPIREVSCGKKKVGGDFVRRGRK